LRLFPGVISTKPQKRYLKNEKKITSFCSHKDAASSSLKIWGQMNTKLLCRARVNKHPPGHHPLDDAPCDSDVDEPQIT
jgi:hypothetical protein